MWYGILRPITGSMISPVDLHESESVAGASIAVSPAKLAIPRLQSGAGARFAGNNCANNAMINIFATSGCASLDAEIFQLVKVVRSESSGTRDSAGGASSVLVACSGTAGRVHILHTPIVATHAQLSRNAGSDRQKPNKFHCQLEITVSIWKSPRLFRWTHCIIPTKLTSCEKLQDLWIGTVVKS